MKGTRYPAAQRLVYVRLLNGLFEQLTQDPNWYSQDPKILQDKIAQLFGNTRTVWVLGDIAKKIEHITQEDFQKQLAPVLGVTALAIPSPNELRELFVHQNMKLIQSLPQNLVDQVEQIVLTRLRQGTHVTNLERSIKDKLAITKQKAQLIARDQVSKYSGDLTKHHQTYAGIKKYTWQTSRDERVREEHRALDGQVFDWDRPPVSDKSGGRFHPRQGYRCRCDAIPVVDFSK